MKVNSPQPYHPDHNQQHQQYFNNVYSPYGPRHKKNAGSSEAGGRPGYGFGGRNMIEGRLGSQQDAVQKDD